MERNRTLPRDRHISQVKRLRGFLENNARRFIFFFVPPLMPYTLWQTDYGVGNFRASTTARSRNRASIASNSSSIPWWNRYRTINSFITPLLRRPESWWQERVDVHPRLDQTRTGLRTTVIPISDLYWQIQRWQSSSPATCLTVTLLIRKVVILVMSGKL